MNTLTQEEDAGHSAVIIESERMLLRKMIATDASRVFSYRSDEETNKYQSWIPETKEDVDILIAEKTASKPNVPDSWFQLVIVLKTTGDVIGDVGLHFFETGSGTAEIGCTLDKRHHGQGFAVEALRAALDYLFETLNKRRVTASVAPRNGASLKMLERLGMRQEAHFKESYFFKGEWVDDVIYAMLRSDWDKLKASKI